MLLFTSIKITNHGYDVFDALNSVGWLSLLMKYFEQATHIIYICLEKEGAETRVQVAIVPSIG